jgi:hypothetical protein
MRALYLYFAETARPSRDRSPTTGIGQAVDAGPLIPIQPGAFSRWMVSRERAARDASASVGDAFAGPAPRRPQTSDPTR